MLYLNSKKLYSVFSVVFLLLSLAGSLFLVGQNQDTRNRAAHVPNYGCTAGNLGTMCRCTDNTIGQVYRSTDCTTKCSDCGLFTGTCQAGKTGGTCNCGNGKSGEMYQDTSCSSECVCDDAIVPSKYLPKSPDPSVSYMTGCNQIAVAQVGGCLVSTGPGTIKVSYYTCPNQYNLTTGCNENGVIYETNAICLKNNFCGTQQMDVWGGKSGSCGIDVVTKCETSEKTSTSSTPIPTKTPIPTSTSTPSLTSTPIPTSTPTPILTSTPTPTPTSTSTSTPTPTPTPTFTPTPTPKETPYSTQKPSPTRISLPTAGFEFPSQAFTLTGAIVTLVGILILL